VLDLADVAPYLIDRKLISRRAVVEGRFHVVDVSRLNRVILVTAKGERCVVLKVAGEGGDARAAREAAVLERLSSIEEACGLTPCLPAFVAYDRAEGVLILEGAPGARDLTYHHARGRFSCAIARELGRTLALLHAIRPAALDGLRDPAVPTSRLRVHEPDLHSFHTLSAGAVELTRIIQSVDELCTALDDHLAAWHEDSVIHGDVRWDNCLAWRRGSSSRWARLHLIDWELSGVGDPGLDVGAFFGEYLGAWVRSIPIADPRDPGRLRAHARLPLRRMRPALRAFWETYSSRRGASSAESSATLRRSTRFAAVRLLTAALEEAQTLDEVQASGLSMVQLSQKILRRPREAADLLGLGAWWATA
jgi:aminoglycoside phosphotransferase (APT) family kinase protein